MMMFVAHPAGNGYKQVKPWEARALHADVDTLLLHLGALVWRTEFLSRADLLERGIWLPTIRLAKAREFFAVKQILSMSSAVVEDEHSLARVICEWILLSADLSSIPVTLVYLWLYSDWKRMLVYTWKLTGGGMESLVATPFAPHMPVVAGVDSLALYNKWAETAPACHVLYNPQNGTWTWLEPATWDPICELRRYDGAQWTNVKVIDLPYKTKQVHFVYFDPIDVLPMGAFTSQIYPAQHNKRQFQVPPELGSIHVYRRQGTQWILCVSVRLDSGTWPYFILPYDDTTGVAAVFAPDEPLARHLLEQWIT
jgi:hypothetical protein